MFISLRNVPPISVKEGLDKTWRDFFPKKNRYPWLVTVFIIASLVLNANHHPAPFMEGNDYPDNNYDDVCDLNCVHVVINPDFGNS